MVLKVATVNLNSLTNKVSFLLNFIEENELNIISITETWLISSMSSSYVDLPDFKFFRGDVCGSVRKHGAGLYVQSSYTSVSIDVDLPNIAVVFVEEFDTYFISCYRPPSNSESEDRALRSFLSEFSVGRAVVLLGDFNLPSLKWDETELLVGNVTPHDRAFLDAFLVMGFEQWVRESTFLPSGNVLDLVFTSDDDIVNEVQVLAPLPGCHHCPVVATLLPHCSDPGVAPLNMHRMWHRADYGRMCEYLRTVDWMDEFGDLSAADCYQVFVNVMSEVIDMFVPQVEPRPGRPTWIAKPPRSLISNRSQAWTHYKILRGELGRTHQQVVSAYDDFRSLNSDYRHFSRNKQCEHERKLASALRESAKPFHAYIRRRKEGRPSVGPFRENGNIVSDNYGMAEVLADCFGEIYQSVNSAGNTENQLTDSVMTPLEVSYDAVLSVLQGLDPASACGPDGIHARILKSCSALLAYPLTAIMQKSLLTGSFPSYWSESLVVPIYKRGPRSVASNYRAVSLTPVPCKVMERILVSHIVEYLESNSLLSPHQFGFRAGRCTEDQMLLFYDAVAREVDCGRSVDAVYLDFSKAFDVIVHELLLEKLASLGFDQNVLAWISSFVSGRTMRVAVGGECSTRREVNSGVPQGSVLGPILFLIYVNYLMDGVECSWKAFADDFKLCTSSADQLDSVDEAAALQRDLDRIYRRGVDCSLRLNPDKCVVMRFGRGSAAATPQYTLDGQNIEVVHQYKDLGVWVDNKLKFHHHVRVTAGKAGALVSELLRSTVCRDSEFMVTLFVSHIRPIMDYCSVLWNSDYLGNTRLLESIQRRWTREIAAVQHLSYEERIRTVRLYSVRGRMLRMEIVKIWKCFHAETELGLVNILERAQYTGTRGHQFKLAVPVSHTEVGRRRFGAKSETVGIWNSLPGAVAECTSVEAFKRKLDEHLGDKLYSTV